MAELVPYPFASLVTRMFQELDRSGSIFDLPARRFVRGEADLDFSVAFHGHRAASPLGPAAGPQTQMAQNIVLSWLGGCRIHELKTVQVMDDLEIPRPCIDVRTVGFNAEWSQELTLEQSLEEYVKGAMLVEMLQASGVIQLTDGFEPVVYDLSVGYDLKGIQSPRVAAFIEGMMDATSVVDRLRQEIPTEFGHLRDLDYPTALSDTMTLSTFHGCPPDEIERIIEYLLQHHGLHSIVKFNPMLLGKVEALRLLHDVLGYEHITVPESAFTRDTRWEQAVEFIQRLEKVGHEVGRSVGAKFSNTLIVRNDAGFLPPEEQEVYLSGAPLHVLAMRLVQRFRHEFGDRFPISFSAGIDKGNYPDAVALGLVPITVCTDLLRPGGYGRLAAYHKGLAKRMEAVGATTIDEFILKAYGHGDTALQAAAASGGSDAASAAAGRDFLAGKATLSAVAEPLRSRWLSAARLRNTDHYLEALLVDPRYTHALNASAPRKIDSHLELFDCVTCDICVPVCPNDANFTFGEGPATIAVVKVSRSGEMWKALKGQETALTQRHQIGNFADFCNDCGNCDVFCPEDGGPYVMKPRFFGSEASFHDSTLDGFFMQGQGDTQRILARCGAVRFELRCHGDELHYRNADFDVRFQRNDPAGTIQGHGQGELDLTWALIADHLRGEVLEGATPNYITYLPDLPASGRGLGT